MLRDELELAIEKQRAVTWQVPVFNPQSICRHHKFLKNSRPGEKFGPGESAVHRILEDSR
jgi:hypothetical protein